MDVYKLLAKSNCGDCKAPACLAFAMKVAAGKAHFSECPHLSEESRATLEEMMEPPILEVRVKRGEREVILGGEKVMFRHDESFYHQSAVCIEIPTGLSDEELAERITRIAALSFERAGQNLSVDMIALEDKGEPGFVDYAKKVYGKSELPLVLKTSDFENIGKISKWPRKDGIVIYIDIETVERAMNNRDGYSTAAVEKVQEAIKEAKFSLAIRSSNLEEAAAAGDFFRKNGIKSGIIGIDLFGFEAGLKTRTTGDGEGLKASAASPLETLDLLYSIREGALVSRNRSLGFPTLVWIGKSPNEILDAATVIMKYGSALVISQDAHDKILPLLTLRQNIFTDPRRPVQVEAKLYRFNDAAEGSPVFVTTNFSLTYFTVVQEI